MVKAKDGRKWSYAVYADAADVVEADVDVDTDTHAMQDGRRRADLRTWQEEALLDLLEMEQVSCILK